VIEVMDHGRGYRATLRRRSSTSFIADPTYGVSARGSAADLARHHRGACGSIPRRTRSGFGAVFASRSDWRQAPSGASSGGTGA